MSNIIYHLTGIQHHYEPRTVLRIPLLEIYEGETLVLVGPSGAGKSTLLRLLALLETPSEGSLEMRFDNQLMAYSTTTRRQIGMVFQHPLLLSRSVRANVAYGLRLRGHPNPMPLVEAMLKRVDMLKLADTAAHTLSGGEIQRVALARALVLEPRVLLLDEPTANLDPTNVRIIESILRERQQHYQPTVVLVTHNIFQARRLATRVGLLLDGELVEAQGVEQFFTAPQDARTAAFVSGDLVY